MTALTMDVKDQVVVITGSTRGIGRGLADYFAEAGAHVAVIGSRSLEMAQQAATEITQRSGTEAFGLQIDVSSEEMVEQGIQDIYEKFGRIDVLINNAGIQIISPIDSFAFSDWKKLLAIHIDGAFLMTKACFKLMKKQQSGGKIINMGSIHSFFVSPNKAAYCTAKHALLGLTRETAKEGGPYNIATHLIGPAFVMTDLVKKQIPERAKAENITEKEVMESMVQYTVDGQFTTIEEVARLALFLSSTKGNAYTGQSLMASHGWGMS